jgi:Cof subfamily protein (haloacid dehalogenase superfamily)
VALSGADKVVRQGGVSAASIRLLLADVDGTLVTQEKVLTDRALAAARALKEAGVALAITSGRPPRGMSMLIEPLGLATPIAGFNGGVFVKPDLSVIETHGLEAKAARQALDLILKQGLDAWLYTPDAWLIRDPKAPHVAREAWTVKFEAEVKNDFTDEDLAKAVKIVGVSDDLAAVERCEKAVQDALGDRASAARSQPYYLDVTSPQANKGVVVASLSRMLDIPPTVIATIGDMPNDVLMFARSGFSIAMGNASDQVKARADAVTDANDDEGFAKAVEKFILPRASNGDPA